MLSLVPFTRDWSNFARKLEKDIINGEINNITLNDDSNINFVGRINKHLTENEKLNVDVNIISLIYRESELLKLEIKIL